MWSVEIQKDLRSVSIIGRACLQAVTGGGGALVTKSYLTFVTPWTVAHQASLSMGFARQEYWGRVPFPSKDLPNPEILPTSPEPPAVSHRFFTMETPGEQISQLIMFDKLIDYFFFQ